MFALLLMCTTITSITFVEIVPISVVIAKMLVEGGLNRPTSVSLNDLGIPFGNPAEELGNSHLIRVLVIILVVL